HGKPTAGTSTSPAHARPLIAVPGCTTKTARAKTLHGVPSHVVQVGHQPFDVMPDGKFAFVSDASGITVLDTTQPVPQVLGSVPLQQAQGEALTPDGHLLVATGSGMTVFPVGALEQGSAKPLGSLTVPGGIHAVEVAVSRDGNFAFVSLQNSSQVAVFN